MRSGVWTSRRVLSFRRPGWSLGMISEWGGWPSRLPPFRRLCPQHLLAWAGPGIGAWHWCRRCWGWQTRALCPPRGVGCRRKHCTACVPGGLCPSSGPPPPGLRGPAVTGGRGASFCLPEVGQELPLLEVPSLASGTGVGEGAGQRGKYPPSPECRPAAVLHLGPCWHRVEVWAGVSEEGEGIGEARGAPGVFGAQEAARTSPQEPVCPWGWEERPRLVSLRAAGAGWSFLEASLAGRCPRNPRRQWLGGGRFLGPTAAPVRGQGSESWLEEVMVVGLRPEGQVWGWRSWWGSAHRSAGAPAPAGPHLRQCRGGL